MTKEEIIVKEIIQKIYPRWLAIQKAKKLVDVEWVNEQARKLAEMDDYDHGLTIVIEGLLKGTDLEKIEEAVPMGTMQGLLKEMGVKLEEKAQGRIISKLDWERLHDPTVNEVKLRFYSEGELHHYFGDFPDDHSVEVTFKKCGEENE